MNDNTNTGNPQLNNPYINQPPHNQVPNPNQAAVSQPYPQQGFPPVPGYPPAPVPQQPVPPAPGYVEPAPVSQPIYPGVPVHAPSQQGFPPAPGYTAPQQPAPAYAPQQPVPPAPGYGAETALPAHLQASTAAPGLPIVQQATEGAVLVEAQNLEKYFLSRCLWTGLTFTVRAGEMMAVVGQSGSGKSTLLNCLGSLEKLTTGTLTVDGSSVNKMGALGRRKYLKKSVGFLFQNYALVEPWTVSKNLDIAMNSRKNGLQLKSEALKTLGIDDKLKEPVYRLSGGEQQRVAATRLLLKKPMVILADEPTSALDDGSTEILMGQLRKLCEEGACLIVATHDPRVIRHCHQVLDVSKAGGTMHRRAA